MPLAPRAAWRGGSAARPAPSGPRPAAAIKIGPSRPPTGFEPLTEHQQAVVDDFHRLYYEQRVDGRRTVILSWLGWPMFKNPFDLWTYQEIVTATRPELIVECGTRYGGGALFLASLFDLIGGPGEVLTIDTDTTPKRPVHPRIRYVAGSSVDPDVVASVRAAAKGRRTIVILDSDHSAAHVRKELEIYPELVSVGLLPDRRRHGHGRQPGLAGRGSGSDGGPRRLAADDRRVRVRSGSRAVHADPEPAGLPQARPLIQCSGSPGAGRRAGWSVSEPGLEPGAA